MAVAGKVPVKRNRFLTVTGAYMSVNRALGPKPPRAGRLNGYLTNIANPSLEVVIGACAPRPIYHHKRDSIEAHLSVVFAALAVTRLIEDRTSWVVDQALRAHHTPLPNRRDLRRATSPHRRRPTPTRPTRRTRSDHLNGGAHYYESSGELTQWPGGR